jgi:hypothetical protein
MKAAAQTLIPVDPLNYTACPYVFSEACKLVFDEKPHKD